MASPLALLALALLAAATLALGDGAAATAVEPTGAPDSSSTVDDLTCSASADPVTLGSPAGSAWRVVGESIVDPRIWSGHLVAQAVADGGGASYVAYYDGDRHLAVARRAAGEETWTAHRIPGDGGRVGWDSHNGIALGIDARGGLHIAANMHGDPMRYWFTPTPSDLGTIERVPTMVAPAVEREVTYPAFANRADGALAFSFRDGSSGAGDVRLYAFDAAERRWADLLGGPLLGGEGGRNAYLQLTQEPNAEGWFEAVWLWRSTPDASTNARLSYMRSRDLATWETAGGEPVPLPAVHGTDAVIVDDIPEGGGILNGSTALGATEEGAPVLAYYRYDAAGDHQLFAATPEGAGWRAERLTDWRGSFAVEGTGTLGIPLAVERVEAAGSGRVRVDYRCGGSSPRAGSLLLDVPSLAVVGDGAMPEAGLPSTALRPVEGSADAPVVRSAQVATGTGALAIVWQSQGTNHDRPFPTTPAPQPLRALDLVPATPPEAPRELAAVRSEAGVAVTWAAPRDDGGRPVTGYRLERSIDGGPWEPAPNEGTQASIPASELSGATVVDLRVAARSALGTGSPVEGSVVVAEPGTGVSAPGASTEPPERGLPWLAAALAAAAAVVVALLLRRRRREAGTARRSGR